jgi:hypothetical protein
MAENKKIIDSYFRHRGGKNVAGGAKNHAPTPSSMALYLLL